uniref:Uncharacterized protein n=1 Tax=Psilocybe cubensis TaxID=181762 RepID=A0A8H7XUS3_PSICU
MLAPLQEPLVFELNAEVGDGEAEDDVVRDVEDGGDITVVNLDVDDRDLEDVELDDEETVVEEDGATIAVDEDEVDIEGDDGGGDGIDGIVVGITPTVTVLVPDSVADGWVRDAGTEIGDTADGKGVSNEPVIPVRLERFEHNITVTPCLRTYTKLGDHPVYSALLFPWSVVEVMAI